MAMAVFNCENKEQLVDVWLFNCCFSDETTFIVYVNDVSTILVKRPVFVASPALLVATPRSLFNLSPLDMFLPHFMLHIHYPFFSLDILLPIQICHTIQTYEHIWNISHLSVAKKLDTAYPDSIGPHLPQWLFAPGSCNSCGEGMHTG